MTKAKAIMSDENHIHHFEITASCADLLLILKALRMLGEFYKLCEADADDAIGLADTLNTFEREIKDDEID